MPKYEAYQMPDTSPGYLSFPDWIKDAIATHDIRVTADGEDVYVRTAAGVEFPARPGDWIIRASLGFFVADPHVYAALTERGVEDLVNLPGTPRPDTPPIKFDLGPGPYSSSVLARSARARAAQGVPDPPPPAPPPPAPPSSDAPAVENAQIEGADAPITDPEIAPLLRE